MATTQSLSTRAPVQSPERVQQRASASPRVDVYENANELLVLADVPGATKENIQIHLDKGQLTLEARRDPADHGTALATEYRPVDYHRVFTVPQGIDATKIEAELTAGVLRVRLPKSDALKPRKIEIKAS
jgi:HSP20 family molecular chaperone IbpA